MDSRIREIEQWLSEAKQDLGECGREAYIRKLFLLDAEIRAVIKENGAVPEIGSPQSQAKRVRRLGSPALALGALGVALLTATVYFVQPAVSVPFAKRTQHETPRYTADAMDAAHSEAFIPREIPGEEILPNGWTPEIDQPALDQPSQEEAPTQETIPAAAKPNGPGVVIAANIPATKTQPAAAKPAPVAIPAAIKRSAGSQGATDVVILAANTSNSKQAPRVANTASRSASMGSGSFAGGAETGMLSASHKFDYFPESGKLSPTPLNQAKDGAKKLNKNRKRGGQAEEIIAQDPENPVGHDGDTADGKNPGDKLDPDELKAKLEKRFNK
jgi:hypothetical protein